MKTQCEGARHNCREWHMADHQTAIGYWHHNRAVGCYTSHWTRSRVIFDFDTYKLQGGLHLQYYQQNVLLICIPPNKLMAMALIHPLNVGISTDLRPGIISWQAHGDSWKIYHPNPFIRMKWMVKNKMYGEKNIIWMSCLMYDKSTVTMLEYALWLSRVFQAKKCTGLWDYKWN